MTLGEPKLRQSQPQNYYSNVLGRYNSVPTANFKQKTTGNENKD